MLKWILMTFSSLVFAAPANVVSQSVGQVGERVVTSREVQISKAIENVLYPPKEGTAKELRLGDAGFISDVTAVLLEVVVFKEAENFSLTKVGDEQIQDSLRKLEKALDGKSSWQSLEVSSNELKKFTLQKLAAKSFIQFKTNSMSGVISDSEALAYYEKNRLKFGDLPFASFKDNIKTFLAQQQLEERTRAWFEIIKRKYKVRNILAENMNNKVSAQ